MNTAVVRLGSRLLLFAVSILFALLGCAIGLFHFELNTLHAVVCALVMQLAVLGLDLLAPCFAVAATAGTEYC